MARTDERKTRALPILASIAVSTLILGIAQLIFVALSPAIIAATPAIPPQLAVPWARWAIAEHDGIETYVALPGMLLFLVTTVGLTFALRKVSRSTAVVLALMGAITAVVIVVRTRSSEFFPLSEVSLRVLFCIVTSSLLGVWYVVYTRASIDVRRICLIAGFICFAAVVVLSLPQPSLPDYGYFIGPGLKLLQGERLGAFYLQYNLIETFLFTAMIAAGLKVHWMAVVLSALFVGWYLIYWQIARRLFQHRFIALLCMAALVVTRFLAIRDHPVMWPQVLPLRLDLWAPVLLSVIAWGLVSWRTSLVFGITYALDSTFGFLFATVYAAALAVAWWWSSDRKAGLRRGVLLILPAVAAGCFHKLVFGSFVSPAASHYLGVQIGFLPISSRSLFWPITMLIGWAAALFALHHKDSTGRIGLLLAAFAGVQFIYFFGRSHDHNLLNISSVWLFLIFLAVDQAIEIGRARILIAAGIVLALSVMSTRQFGPKVKRIGEKLQSGVWIVPHPLETALDDNRGRIDPDTVLADSADAYLNYRLGLRQRGFYVPFEANIFMNDTAAWMDEQIREQRPVRTTDSSWAMWLPEFNQTPIMMERGRRFSLVPNGFLMEIVESRSK